MRRLKSWLILGLVIGLPACGYKDPNAGPRIVAPANTIVGYTGSMKPTLKGGEPIHIEPAAISTIHQGDIIVYYEQARRYNILHRVVRIIHAANGETGLLCRGDNNDEPDLHIVTQDNLVGIVTFLKT